MNEQQLVAIQEAIAALAAAVRSLANDGGDYPGKLYALQHANEAAARVSGLEFLGKE